MSHHPNTIDYYCFTVISSVEITEILLTFLGDSPFSGFEVTDVGFLAYWPDHLGLDSGTAIFEQYQHQFDFTVTSQLVKQQNWNAVWESNFEPITVDSFCTVRAPFHEVSDQTTHEIVIDPKMAFGTGHHATTFMMMQQMEHIDFKGKTVLDFGCGTGILAILASKLGAAGVYAIDNDPVCCENTMENTILNQIGNTYIQLGETDDIPDNEYQVILANINLNVILKSLKKLDQVLSQHGNLLISGILASDKTTILKSIEQHQFKVKELLTNKEWICLHLTRP